MLNRGCDKGFDTRLIYNQYERGRIILREWPQLRSDNVDATRTQSSLQHHRRGGLQYIVLVYGDDGLVKHDYAVDSTESPVPPQESAYSTSDRSTNRRLAVVISTVGILLGCVAMVLYSGGRKATAAEV